MKKPIVFITSLVALSVLSFPLGGVAGPFPVDSTKTCFGNHVKPGTCAEHQFMTVALISTAGTTPVQFDRGFPDNGKGDYICYYQSVNDTGTDGQYSVSRNNHADMGGTLKSDQPVTLTMDGTTHYFEIEKNTANKSTAVYFNVIPTGAFHYRTHLGGHLVGAELNIYCTDHRPPR